MGQLTSGGGKGAFEVFRFFVFFGERTVMGEKQGLQAPKAAWKAHQAQCSRCQRYEGHTGDLVHLCYQGVILFKVYLDQAEKFSNQKRQHA